MIVDNGTYKLGTQTYQNAKGASFGALNLTQAIKVSSDIFFFELGAKADAKGPIIQQWARELGLARRTGIDLPGEFSGLVPDRRWRDAAYQRYLRCAKKAKVTPGTTQALYACGGIERPWTPGDNVNLAVGQGDLQATPLQMAEVYSTLVNGGTVVQAASGQRGPGRRRAADRAIAHAAPPACQSPRRRSFGNHAGAARGRHPARGHVSRHLPRLSLSDLRQDRHRRACTESRPGVVCRIRGRADQADRDRHHGRARRVRRRDRRRRRRV